MPSGQGIMAGLFREAIRNADCFLRQECAARRLADGDARAVHDRSFVAGWQLTVQSQRRLNIYVDAQFPFSLPRFVLVDRPPFPAWPHIEEDGLMCLPASRVAKFRQPENIIGELLRDAYRLIRDCESGALEEDFRTEFHTYWNRRLSTDSQVVRSLVIARGPSRIVHVWAGETHPVIAESEQEVLSWLRKRWGDKPQFDETREACFLWLGNALAPSEYPNNAADVYRVGRSVSGGKELLERLAKRAAGPFYFLIGADSGNGPCFAAVRTAKPVSTDIGGAKRDLICKGFRPGKVPVSLQVVRLFSSDAPATRLRVERVDAEWIHGRGHDPRQQELRSKTVIVFGCGSVGAPLAQQLAMSGVGRTVLVDPQRLTWANVGRHPLGAPYVDSYKALALAEVLQRAYPHSEFQGFTMTSHEFLLRYPELVKAADLIICSVADWKAEIELTLLQRSSEIAIPVLDVWTEPHACAGHAVVIFPSGPCLQCGFHLAGDSKLRVTDWPSGKTEQTEAACGAIFQPYGPIELLGTIMIAAGLALEVLLKKVVSATHRIWAGAEQLLLEAGGTWSESWINGETHRKRGAFQEERVWERDRHCPICGDGADYGSRSFIELASPPSISSSATPS